MKKYSLSCAIFLSFYQIFNLSQACTLVEVAEDSIFQKPVLSHYDSDFYNTLPYVEDADNNLKSSANFDDFLLKTKKIAEKYRLDDIMGLRLIHRHAYLNKNEAMIEDVETIDGKDAFVTRPVDLLSDDSAPSGWILKGPREWGVFEFSNDSSVGLGFKRLQGQEGFFKEMENALVQYGLQKLISLAVMDRSWYKNYPGHVMFLEKSYEEPSFSSVVLPTNSEDPDSLNAIRTAWQLSDRPITHGCFYIHACVSTGRGHISSGYHG